MAKGKAMKDEKESKAEVKREKNAPGGYKAAEARERKMAPPFGKKK